MDFLIILNSISRKKLWNWVLQFSLNLILQGKNREIKLCNFFLKLISRKNSWNHVKQLYLKLFSWKKSWNQVLQLSLNLISRKNSWNQVKQLTSFDVVFTAQYGNSRNFLSHFFLQKFRESDGFTKEITK